MDYTWGPTRRIERVAKIAAWFHQAPSGLQGEVLAVLEGVVEVLSGPRRTRGERRLSSVHPDQSNAWGTEDPWCYSPGLVEVLRKAGLLVKKSS